MNKNINSPKIEFKLFSPNAEAVELCIFDSNFTLKNAISMRKDSDGFWHELLEKQELIYAYRLYGEWNPRAGKWFNSNKFMFDPNAQQVARAPIWDQKLFPYKNKDLEISPDSNIACAALSAIANHDFDWGNDRAPNTSWSETVIYEAHLKGLSNSHPEVEVGKRGTYLGLASEAIISHLKKLGITAIELLPIQAFFSEYSLYKNGLNNYWGYNPYGWQAPEPRYASQRGQEVNELKSAIKALHAAGIEVILDVVFNHSAEGEFFGPALSLRGIDNSYYLFNGDYINYTGCGNTLDFSKEQVINLTVSSLETWVRDYHIDGFRFDLSTTLIRNGDKINLENNFFNQILDNPIFKHTKFIAEPWDLGPNSYQLGNFPKSFSEWNDKYRDTVRKYWSGWDGTIADFATRISGSSDKFKTPLASINFITAHDGFTLRDLVSYAKKNNLANLESNLDGSDNNFSSNFGVEGETDNKEIIAIRKQQIRNFLFTLFFSAGVPMLTSGDEIGKTQSGNNNAYCQDNELSWLDWNVDFDFRDFISKLSKLRKELKVFNPQEFYNQTQLNWINEAGLKMEDWQSQHLKIIGAVYGNIIVAYNSSEKDVDFNLNCDSFLRVDTSKEPYLFEAKLDTKIYRLSAKSAALFVGC